MSVLVHRCRACGHATEWHEGANGGYTPCRCCRVGSPDPDPEPTLLPTWTSPGGVPEPPWAPGTRRNAGTMHASTTCACKACDRAFRALAAAASRALSSGS